MIVVTERLGRPRTILGDIVQTKSVYPIDSDTPTALCHLLPAPDLPALCGHPWEALVEVPMQSASRTSLRTCASASARALSHDCRSGDVGRDRYRASD